MPEERAMSSPRRSVDHRLATWCLAIGSLVVTACSGGPTASLPGNRSPYGSAAGVAGAAGPAIPSPDPISATSPAPSAAAPIPDGDYLSGYVTKDMAKRMLSDPAIASDPLVKQFLDQY